MKKSTVQLVHALNGILLEFPGIVNDLERKDASFIHRLFAWLRRSEEILTTYQISGVSALAGLRSKLTAPIYADNRSLSLRKLQLKTAAENLFDMQQTLLSVLTPLELKVEECRTLIRQLLVLVSQAHAIQYDRDSPFDQLIQEVWQFIISNDQLRAGAVTLKTALTMTDIQLLMAEELNPEDF